MDIRPLAISSIWWFLIAVAECGVHTVTTATKLSSSGSVVNQHAEQPACERSRRYGMTCHVPVLDGNIDFRNYTGNIFWLKLYCDKKRYLPSRLIDGLFAPLGQTLKRIYIHDCYIINISRHAFDGLERLQPLLIRGGSYPEMDDSWLEISTVSNSTQPSQTNLASPSTTWYHDNLVLPEGVFSELPNLYSLELTAMRLNNSVWHVIKHLRNLDSLFLNNNNITVININTNNNLQNLTYLYLSDNYIQVIPNRTFESLGLLRYLDLSSNRIRLIGREAFKGLRLLFTLQLYGNNMRTMDRDIFQGLGNLSSLDLSANNIRTMDRDIFQGLGELSSLDLSANSIRTIDRNILQGLGKLYRLDLSANNIRTIDRGVFAGLSQLHRLNLSVNKISIVELHTFEGLNNLNYLYLAENRVRILSQLTLSRLSSLCVLDLSCNFIETIPKFPISLASLNLRNNSIMGMDKSSFAGLQRLTHRDLSHNKINEFTQFNIPYTMKNWNLSSNELTVASLNLTSKLVFADFRNNNLISLAINGLEDYRSLIYLAENGDPFQCTCKIELSNNESTFSYDRSSVAQYHIWNFRSLNCMSVSENTQEAGITEISARMFVCKASCYVNCTCYHWKYGDDNINIVDCLGAGLAAVPINVSVSCTILNLSGNKFQSLEPDNFYGLSKLEELYLNSSNITEIKEGTFREMSGLRKLDLSYNGIRILDSGIFIGLSRLLSLDLSFNSLHVVRESTFKYFDGLNNLDLAENELETISSSNIESLYTIKYLQLSNNPWTCDCEFLETFKPFTIERVFSIKDLTDMICIMSNKIEYFFVQINMQVFCPDKKKTKPMTITDITLISSFCVFIVGNICFCILFRKREFFRLLCFIICGGRPSKNEIDRPYDAFVAFNNDDVNFVVTELMPRLEVPYRNRLAYKLCVYFRDFPVGVCIANAIVSAVKRSKRVIILMSDNFLKSEWCHYEFQAALEQLLREKKNRIITVLLHDINTELLDEKLKMFLSTRTYVRVDDPMLWSKIEYAMPKKKRATDDNVNADDQIENIVVDVHENQDDDAHHLH